MDNPETRQLLVELQQGSRTAFEKVYRLLANKLLGYIHSRIGDKSVSEEMVQEIFVSLWTNKTRFEHISALEAYMFKACKYQILNYIRSEKVRYRYLEHFSLFFVQEQDNSVEQMMDMTDLKAVIDQHIAQLSPKCKEAFQLNRFMHKSITETAELMNISTRTVENYITQALSHLRKNLSQYQWMLFLISLSLGGAIYPYYS